MNVKASHVQACHDMIHICTRMCTRTNGNMALRKNWILSSGKTSTPLQGLKSFDVTPAPPKKKLIGCPLHHMVQHPS